MRKNAKGWTSVAMSFRVTPTLANSLQRSWKDSGDRFFADHVRRVLEAEVGTEDSLEFLTRRAEIVERRLAELQDDLELVYVLQEDFMRYFFLLAEPLTEEELEISEVAVDRNMDAFFRQAKRSVRRGGSIIAREARAAVEELVKDEFDEPELGAQQQKRPCEGISLHPSEQAPPGATEKEDFERKSVTLSLRLPATLDHELRVRWKASGEAGYSEFLREVLTRSVGQEYPLDRLCGRSTIHLRGLQDLKERIRLVHVMLEASARFMFLATVHPESEEIERRDIENGRKLDALLRQVTKLYTRDGSRLAAETREYLRNEPKS